MYFLIIFLSIFLSNLTLANPQYSANLFKEFSYSAQMEHIPTNRTINIPVKLIQKWAKKTHKKFNLSSSKDTFCHHNIAHRMAKGGTIELADVLSDIPAKLKSFYLVFAMLYSRGNQILFEKLAPKGKTANELIIHFASYKALASKTSILSACISEFERSIRLSPKCYHPDSRDKIVSYDRVCNCYHPSCFHDLNSYLPLEPDTLYFFDVSPFCCFCIITNKQHTYLFDPTGGLVRCHLQNEQHKAFRMIAWHLSEFYRTEAVTISTMRFTGFEYEQVLF